jgi:hypothetical protein
MEVIGFPGDFFIHSSSSIQKLLKKMIKWISSFPGYASGPGVHGVKRGDVDYQQL